MGRAQAVVVFAIVLALAATPVVADNYMLRLATTAAMYIALAGSWNLIGGLAGYPSFATAAFFGLGAYGAAVVISKAHVPLLIGWTTGAMVATLFAATIGPAILRLRGHYFAVASLVMAAVLRELVNSATGLTGGGMGLNLPPRVADVTTLARLYFWAMLVLALAAVAAGMLIPRTKLGWALRCIEQNEDAAIVLGIDTLFHKSVAFALSGLFAGLAGAIYATWIGYIDPTDVFDDLLSVKPIVMVLLGGVGTQFAPVIGGVFYLALEELVWRNLLSFHAGVLGLAIVALLVFLPGGLKDVRSRVRVIRRRRVAPVAGTATQ
jgi:branched-chain amino acid transport system permease protein